MEIRKKGNNDDLQALNLYSEQINKENPSINNKTMTVDKGCNSITSENSNSIVINQENKNTIKDKNMLTKYNSENNFNQSIKKENKDSSNFLNVELILKNQSKQNVNLSNLQQDNNDIKKNYHSNNLPNNKHSVDITNGKNNENSTLRMNIDQSFNIKPQQLLSLDNKKITNVDLIELLKDNELKYKNSTSIQRDLNETYWELEKEIEFIKQKFQNKIKKYNNAIEFLKRNPHLNNLKEYEDYMHFSKFLDNSKISNYSFKSHNGGNDESIGVASFLPHHEIKVVKYKDNNISSKFK